MDSISARNKRGVVGVVEVQLGGGGGSG